MHYDPTERKPHILYVNDMADRASALERRMVLRIPGFYEHPLSRRDIDLSLDHPSLKELDPPKGTMEEAVNYAWALYSIGHGLVIAGHDQSSAQVEALATSVSDHAGQEHPKGLRTFNLGAHGLAHIPVSYARGYRLIQFIQQESKQVQS